MAGRAGVPVKEAAELLGCSPNTIWRLIGREQLVAYNIGRAVRVRSESLIDFIEGRPE